MDACVRSASLFSRKRCRWKAGWLLTQNQTTVVPHQSGLIVNNYCKSCYVVKRPLSRPLTPHARVQANIPRSRHWWRCRGCRLRYRRSSRCRSFRSKWNRTSSCCRPPRRTVDSRWLRNATTVFAWRRTRTQRLILQTSGSHSFFSRGTLAKSTSSSEHHCKA